MIRIFLCLFIFLHLFKNHRVIVLFESLPFLMNCHIPAITLLSLIKTDLWIVLYWWLKSEIINILVYHLILLITIVSEFWWFDLFQVSLLLIYFWRLANRRIYFGWPKLLFLCILLIKTKVSLSIDRTGLVLFQHFACVIINQRMFIYIHPVDTILWLYH